jgi:hypothetical protein
MTIEELREKAEAYKDDYEYVAIRTQEEPFELGKIDHVSSVWDNGDETDDKLDGISATLIDDPAVQMHVDKNYRYGYYFGNHKAIVCGNHAASGEDVGEIIISDPVVMEVLA